MAVTGSPPHTRGKETEDATTKGIAGITPAYAGKSVAHSSYYAFTKDHPRIRGEKIQFIK